MVFERSLHDLTIIRLQLAIYFCLHRGKYAGKHGKLASLYSLRDRSSFLRVLLCTLRFRRRVCHVRQLVHRVAQIVMFKCARPLRGFSTHGAVRVGGYVEV